MTHQSNPSLTIEFREDFFDTRTTIILLHSSGLSTTFFGSGELIRYGLPDLLAEHPVDDRVDGRVPVADPQDGRVDPVRRVQLQKGRQGHPDEEGEPTDDESTHHDAHWNEKSVVDIE